MGKFFKKTKLGKWWTDRNYKIECKKEEEKFKAKCKEADDLHKKTGKRYFVVPATDTELMVVDNNYVKAYNIAASKKGSRMKKINIHDLINMAYYSTSAKGMVRKIS